MPRSISAVTIVIAFATMFLAAATLHAQEPDRSQGKEGPMMAPGTMNMMGQMSRMMDHCNQMMQGDSGRPNDQWRDGAPPAGGETGKKQ